MSELTGLAALFLLTVIAGASVLSFFVLVAVWGMVRDAIGKLKQRGK